MSMAENCIDDALEREMLAGEGDCHGLPISPRVFTELARNDRLLREERFERFFRTDGEVPEWRTGGSSYLFSCGQWVRIDRMGEGHICNVIARNKAHLGYDIALSSIMELPRHATPQQRLGDGFARCKSWSDALVVIFDSELQRRVLCR